MLLSKLKNQVAYMFCLTPVHHRGAAPRGAGALREGAGRGGPRRRGLIRGRRSAVPALALLAAGEFGRAK